MIKDIKEDLYRRYGQENYSWFQLLKIGQIPQVSIMMVKRKVDFYRRHNRFLYLLYSLRYRSLKIKYGCDIPASLNLGKGFLVEHIGGITINPEVIIGDNCAIYNGVTIGIEKRGKRKGVPTIGNKVWMGANSIIVGKITIGNNVLIAPGSFVNFDVPSNSVVMGNPGTIICSINATKDYITNIV